LYRSIQWWLQFFGKFDSSLFLRHLYRFIKDSKFPKFHKVTVTTSFSVFYTIILPKICSLVFLTPHLSILQFGVDSTLWSLSTNIIIISMAGVASLMGVICLLLDIYAHRSGIKVKGWKRFLLWEDPFMVRVDLIFVSCIFVIIVTLTVLSALGFNESTVVLRFVMGMLVYAICGGNIMAIAELRNLTSRGDTCCPSSTVYEEYLNSPSFYEMFYYYCENENILLLERLDN